LENPSFILQNGAGILQNASGILSNGAGILQNDDTKQKNDRFILQYGAFILQNACATVQREGRIPYHLDCILFGVAAATNRAIKRCAPQRRFLMGPRANARKHLYRKGVTPSYMVFPTIPMYHNLLSKYRSKMSDIIICQIFKSTIAPTIAIRNGTITPHAVCGSKSGYMKENIMNRTK
jgi:hypothetical protein